MAKMLFFMSRIFLKENYKAFTDVKVINEQKYGKNVSLYVLHFLKENYKPFTNVKVINDQKYGKMV